MTYVDGRKIYQKTVYYDSSANDTLYISTGVSNLREMIKFNGVFHSHYPNIRWTMHFPYWYGISSTSYYGIYAYYDPGTESFSVSGYAYPGGQTYYTGRYIVTFRYTKN